MILVTGGTGLVGSHLLHLLLSKNEEVKATYRSEASLEKARKVFESYDAIDLFDRIHWVQADLIDYYSLKELFTNVDFVYHSAAIVSFDRRKAHKMHEINVEGTQHLVNLSLEFGIKKFCFVSSVASLGKYTDGKCTDEEALWQHDDDISDYSISKYYAENEVWRAAEEGLPVVIVNPSTIIGYSDWNESSSAIIKRVDRGLHFYTPGSTGFVGVKDVVKAMYLLMKSDTVNERYIISGANWKFKEMLSSIALGLGKKPPLRLAPRRIANIMRRLDELRYFLFGTAAVLTKHSVAAAYRNKCFSSEKFKEAFNFEFQPLEEVVQEVTALYSRS